MNPHKIIIGSLCFFWKDSPGGIPEMCLGWKTETPNAIKRKIAHVWNGWGGKVEDIDQGNLVNTCVREVFQESGVTVTAEQLSKVGVITYRREGVPDFECHIFIARVPDAKPQPSIEIIKPTWFQVSDLPYSKMMSGDPLILPAIICGLKVKGVITYNQEMEVVPYETHVEMVNDL
jgi:NUDIX domain